MLIVDTGPLVAAANRADPDHDASTKLIATHAGPLVVPALVLAEAGYLVAKYLGASAEAALLRSLATERFQLVAPTAPDLERSALLVAEYASLGLGTTDACTVALAERLNVAELATLDRRHFGVVRPRHVDGFRLVPG